MQKSLVRKSQRIILKRIFILTFVLIFSYTILGFIFEALFAGLGLMDEESSLFDLYMYIGYSTFSLLICMLIMSTYAIRYIRYLWQEVGAWAAICATVVTLGMGTVTSYWWFYKREIKHGKHQLL